MDQAEVQVYQSVPDGGFFADSAIVLFTQNSSFASYALATPIGPLTGPSTGYTGGAYETASGETFYLAGPFNEDHRSKFTASVKGTVPEPGTFLLAFAGLAGAWAVRKFREVQQFICRCAPATESQHTRSRKPEGQFVGSNN